LEPGDKSHHPWLCTGYLDMRAQSFQIPGGQGQVVFPTQVEDGLQADIPIQMTVEFHERNRRVNQCSSFLYGNLAGLIGEHFFSTG
jgi:hypothetical protein